MEMIRIVQVSRFSVHVCILLLSHGCILSGTNISIRAAHIYSVESDATCCIAGMCCDHTFRIKDHDGNEIGKIVKQKPSSFQEVATELASDSDVFAIEFNKDLDVNKKATLFGALYLIDYMFFENEGEANVDVVNQKVSYKLCDLYCCGCTCPCKISCGGKDSGDSN